MATLQCSMRHRDTHTHTRRLRTLVGGRPSRVTCGVSFSELPRAEYTVPTSVMSTCKPPARRFFGKQFHYPLHGEKTRFGPKAAARPVSNSSGAGTGRCR